MMALFDSTRRLGFSASIRLVHQEATGERREVYFSRPF
jgi:hypothetical protein